MMEYSTIVRLKRDGSRIDAYEVNTGDTIRKIPFATRDSAEKNGYYLGKILTDNGNHVWKRLKEIPANYSSSSNPFSSEDKNPSTFEYQRLNDDEIRVRVANATRSIPATLVTGDLQWKLGIRAILRGENILLSGPSGFGKTKMAYELAKAENRPFEKFNMGSMQDARASLIGNTHYDPAKGTFFAGSKFIESIQIKGSVILLDEYTRISPDAENIMLSVLDQDQRYIRIDEYPNTPTIEVAEGVCFISTANIGAEYTSTRIIDRATKDRFSTLIDMPMLDKQQELSLLELKFPKLNKKYIDGIASIACFTRENVKSDNPTLDTVISTRSTNKQAELAMDGFRFTEIMEALVFSMYSNEGGTDSNRAEMKISAQAWQNLDNESPLISENKVKKQTTKKANLMDDLFNPDDDAF